MRVGAHAFRGPRYPHALHQLDRAVKSVALRHVGIVNPDLLGDLGAHAVHRVERAHRILEDHRNPRAAEVLELRLACRDHVLTVEQRLALEAGVGAAREAHQRHRGNGLAGARLAHDRHHLAAVDRERHAVHGLNDAVLGGERHAQVRHLQERRFHSGCHESRMRGSKNAYRMSTTAARITTAKAVSSTIARIGTMSSFPIESAASCPTPWRL